MAPPYEDFSAMRRRGAPPWCLINNKGNIENSTIFKILGMLIKTIKDIRKELESSGDPEMVVKRKTKSKEATRTVRDTTFNEGPSLPQCRRSSTTTLAGPIVPLPESWM